MAASPEFLIDGTYLKAEPVGAPRHEWPFRVNGDNVSALFEQDYWQTFATFTPQEYGTPFTPASDYYLVKETPPVFVMAGICQFTRTFARIPSQQSVPSSQFVTRPDISGTFPQTLGTSLIIQPDSTRASYDAYASRTVTGDSGAPGTAPTGGTYTLTFAAATTAAINYNDAAATVQTRLNALTPVSDRGNVAVTGSYTAGFAIAFTAYAACTADKSGLTTTGTIVSRIVTANGGYSQTVNIEQADSSPPMTIDKSNIVASGYGSVGTDVTVSVNYAGTGKTRVVISAPGLSYFTGGTYTVTINGATTAAIAYNASSATVQTAISALGGYTISAYFTNTTAIGFDVIGSAGTITAGTFTVTIAGGTTGTIAYNATAAAVQTALNLLAGVTARGNCTVATPNGSTILASDSLSIAFTISFANAAITSTSSLTPTGNTITTALTDSVGRQQSLTLGLNSSTRDLSITGHGIEVGDTIFISDGTTYYTDITNFGVPDVNTIRLIVTPSATWAALASITSAGKRTLAAYTPGISLTRCNRVTDFYLPGVTTGITTADDIPLPTFQGDPASLLLAIFNSSPSINYQVGELAQWRDTPILARTITTINASLL